LFGEGIGTGIIETPDGGLSAAITATAVAAIAIAATVAAIAIAAAAIAAAVAAIAEAATTITTAG
jgi:hypothetical protein